MAFGAFTELVLAVKLFANGPKMSARVRAGFVSAHYIYGLVC